MTRRTGLGGLKSAEKASKYTDFDLSGRDARTGIFRAVRNSENPVIVYFKDKSRTVVVLSKDDSIRRARRLLGPINDYAGLHVRVEQGSHDTVFGVPETDMVVVVVPATPERQKSIKLNSSKELTRFYMEMARMHRGRFGPKRPKPKPRPEPETPG